MKNKIVILAITLVLITFQSCDDENEIYIPEQADTKKDHDKYLTLLLELGFEQSNIIEHDDYYVVEEDLAFQKASLEEYLNGGKDTKSGRTTQRIAGFASVLDENWIGTPIRVFIHPSMNAWEADIVNAINNWNAINHFNIMFEATPNQAASDITVIEDNAEPNFNLAPNVFARVNDFPLNGNPSPLIIVNLNYINGINNLRMEYNMVHELGHSIGFAHTNQAFGELINGTLQNDPNSVMNGGTADNIWAGFSEHDVLSAINVYPDVSGNNFQYALEGNRVGILIGSTLYVKDGDLNALWVRQSSVATSGFQLEGNRIGILTGSTLQVKDGGLHAPWVLQSHVATSGFQLEGNRIGILTGSTLQVKEGGLDAPWVLQSHVATSGFQLEGDRIGILNGPTLQVKDGGLDAPWVLQSHVATSGFQLEGNRIGILNGSTLQVKEGGLHAPWVLQSHIATSGFQLEGSRIGILNGPTLYVKEGPLTGAWHVQSHVATSGFQLEGNRIAILNESTMYTSLYVKSGGILSGWETLFGILTL